MRSIRDLVADYRVRVLLAVELAAVAVGLICGFAPHDPFNLLDAWSASAVALMGLGLFVRSWAAGILRKGRALTTVGPYSLCRHPLYLGTSILFVGSTLIFPGPAIGLPCLVVFLLLLGLTMQREEQRMENRYGADWLNYAARTPRLIPHLSTQRQPAEWTIYQWLQSREYNAPLATGISLVLVKLWILAHAS